MELAEFSNFDLKKYLALNDAIFEFFFNSDRAGQLTTLAFDDEAASEIASEFNMSGGDFAKALALQVRAVVNLGLDNPYQFWARHPKRATTGLLACAVLVMSRLGIGADGTLQHQGFHAAYNRDVLGLLSTDPSRGFKEQNQLWEQFAEYLAKDEGGALGWIRFFRLIEYRNLNYPASQCLVRMSDRAQLQSLFARHCDPEMQQLDRSQIVDVFDNDRPEAFGDPSAGLQCNCYKRRLRSGVLGDR